MNDYICYKVLDEITYLFPNFHSAAVEVWEWICNFIPHFTGHVITYPCLHYISTMLVYHISWNIIHWSITNILIYRAHHVPKSSEWAVFIACYVFHGSLGNIPNKIWQLFCVFLGNSNIYNIGHAIFAIPEHWNFSKIYCVNNEWCSYLLFMF